MKISDDMVYLTDNGAAYCGKHLGASARYTGRDISGQPIMPCTPDVVAEARSIGCALACETCGREASGLYR